jgi:hypothetical protein
MPVKAASSRRFAASLKVARTTRGDSDRSVSIAREGSVPR